MPPPTRLLMEAATPRPTQVLLVDAEAERAHALAETLESSRDALGARLRVEHAQDLRSALERLAAGGIDVVLLDLMLPDSRGTVTFEQSHAFAPDVPIVVLTELDDERVAVSTVRGGAQDYLARGEVDSRILLRSIRYAIERHRLLTALRSLSLIDDLTGLYNRRGFMELGTQFLKLTRRSGRGATLLYMDLDRFKGINDAHGHHVGDRALTRVADIMRAAFRRSDLVARMGGDEFAVLAPAASGEPATMLARRIRDGIESFNQSDEEPYRLSASVGVALAAEGGRSTLDDLLAVADASMYEEKRTKTGVAVS